ncbi:MAG TPA: type II secretion system protein GspM, partial [Steroidobacteraceae bacterium]|nr:type II secretion system protein GspM [Steroidobacteraceae bacterium]
RMKKKQEDLVWMRNAGPELAAAGPLHTGAGGESLLVIIDRSARESGLAEAMAGSEPSGPGGLSIRLQKAPFDTLIAWLARLSQQNGIRVENASIEAAGTPGLVNAAITVRMD